MPSPRLFGRDPSKQLAVEPGESETENKPRGREAGAAPNSSVVQSIVGELFGRGKTGDHKPGV